MCTGSAALPRGKTAKLELLPTACVGVLQQCRFVGGVLCIALVCSEVEKCLLRRSGGTGSLADTVRKKNAPDPLVDDLTLSVFGPHT